MEAETTLFYGSPAPELSFSVSICVSFLYFLPSPSWIHASHPHPHPQHSLCAFSSVGPAWSSSDQDSSKDRQAETMEAASEEQSFNTISLLNYPQCAWSLQVSTDFSRRWPSSTLKLWLWMSSWPTSKEPLDNTLKKDLSKVIRGQQRSLKVQVCLGRHGSRFGLNGVHFITLA